MRESPRYRSRCFFPAGETKMVVNQFEKSDDRFITGAYIDFRFWLQKSGTTVVYPDKPTMKKNQLSSPKFGQHRQIGAGRHTAGRRGRARLGRNGRRRVSSPRRHPFLEVLELPGHPGHRRHLSGPFAEARTHEILCQSMEGHNKRLTSG